MTEYSPSGECNHHLSAFHPVTENDVRKGIKTPATKSCELDEIPTKMLKSCLEECPGIVTEIVNASLDQGRFVSTWKTAIVRSPLKKPGLELAESNYRPVSNLKCISKVLETVALQQFNERCRTFHLLPDYQSAYRQYYSFETALIKIVNDILWHMEGQEVTAMACIDLSAAFDTVDHGTLEKVLRVKFGITGKTLSWFFSYLRPRDFMVNVGEAYSSKKSVTFSVPQGTCAGPVLYSAYASTVTEMPPGDLEIRRYADNHAIKVSFTGEEQTEKLALGTLESSLLEIRKW